MTVLEAMTLGTPVIGGESAGNVPDLLADGAGVVCDIRSPDEIAAAIDRLTGNVELAISIGSAAAARAKEHFDWQHAVGAYLDYLGTILAAEAKTAPQ